MGDKGSKRGRGNRGSGGYDSVGRQGRGGGRGNAPRGGHGDRWGSSGNNYDSPGGRGGGGYRGHGGGWGSEAGYDSPGARGGGAHRGHGGQRGSEAGYDSPRPRGGGGGPRGKSRDEVVIFSAPYPPNPDKKALAGENALQQSYQAKIKAAPESGRDKRFPFRPGYGTRGTPVTLWANYFELAPSRNLTVFRYKVEVAPNDDGKRPTGRKYRRIIELFISQHLADAKHDIATDFKATVISKVKLAESEGGIPVKYMAEDEKEPREKAPTYHVQIAETGTLPISELVDHLTSTQVSSVFDSQEEVIQALNIILGQHPKSSEEVLSIGANRHFPLDAALAETFDLTHGLQGLRGYFVSVRAAASRLLLNVQVKHAACYPPIRLDNLMDQFNQASQNYPKPTLGMMARFLKGLRIRATHIKDEAGRNKARVRRIVGFATPQDGEGPHGPKVTAYGAGPRGVQFFIEAAPAAPLGELTNLGGGSGGGIGQKSGGKAQGPWGNKPSSQVPGTGYTTISDYFRTRHQIRLNRTDLPVVNVGNRQFPFYLPAEVCEVMRGQPAQSELRPDQTSKMIDFAVRKPVQNAQSITTKGAQLLGLGSESASALQNFGLSAQPRLIAVPGRVLPCPRVLYLDNKAAMANGGAWNMQNIKFTIGKTLRQWIALWVKDPSQRYPVYNTLDEVNGTLAEFHTTLNLSGVKAPAPVQPGLTVTVDTRNFGQVSSELERAVDAALAHPAEPRLLFVILPAADTKLYNCIKYLGDVKKGVHTICAAAPKFKGKQNYSNAQYFANVALKFNLKLGGQNQSLEPARLGLIQEGKTMVVGIDVTHPSPDAKSSAPSIAGIVASVDRRLGQWPAEVAIQGGRLEMVAGLGDLLRGRLEHWRDVNNNLPENILVYRDGVSEGQYQLVLEHELPLMRAACEALYPASLTKKNVPRFTIVIVGKRHHTRFYPSGPNDADRYSNPRPGTVVDRGVTEPRNWDFFLQAHAAIKGTARPAHYYIILDEIFRERKLPPQFQNTADVLEDLTYNMCYLFGRATKAVSICPPAYYADLVCERARRYLSHLYASSPAQGPEGDVESGQSGNLPAASDIATHENLKNTMFYV